MKIQGRFIAVLAVLGLLIALLPLAPAGAVTGVVKLDGGEKGQYFSDQTGDNILTIEVTDADLTPTRIGTARNGAASGTSIDLVSYVIAGEKDKTDRFNGGTNNGPCDEADLVGRDLSSPPDGDFNDVGDFAPGSLDALVADDTNTPADADDDPDDTTPANDAVNLLHERCPDIGDGRTIVLNADGTRSSTTTAAIDVVAPTPLTEAELGLLAYEFELTEVARDRQTGSATGVGVNGISDIVSVVVNGRTAQRGNDADDNAPTSSGPWYTVTTKTPGVEADATTAGGGVTHVLLRRVDPQDVDNSVAISYRMSEFDFAPSVDGTDPGPSTTPLNLANSSVRYGGTAVVVGTSPADFAGATSQVTISTVNDTTITTTGAVADATVVTFAYDVKDMKKELVTLNSGNAGDVKLDTEETSASSDKFQVKVAIFSVEDYALINTEAGNDDNDADSMNGVGVAELNNTNGLSAATETGDRTLAARVTAAAEALGMADASATDFVAKVIPARHGDVLNVVYVDANPSVRVSKTATVDLEAPVVTLITPADNFFTNTSTVSFSVDVVDTGAGVPDSSDGDAPVITVQAGTAGISLGDLIRTPIVDGYRLTVNPEGAISEGTKRWFAGVRDKVGNEPVRNDPETEDVNEAPKGAAGLNASTADNAFKFTVDTRAPELSAGETGLYLKNAGVTSGADQETEASNSRTWVKVEFATHDGGAPLDPTTVSADDFRVGGLAPLDARINAKAQGDTAKGTAVYLQVGQMDTDARPEVQLTGEVKDKAGNIRTEGRLTAIADGLNPILEVTPSTDLAEKEITVTISSSETLRSNPMLEITETKPVKNTALTSATTQSVSLVTGSLTRWTTTVKNVTGQASRKYVVVTGTDLSNNSAIVGDATNEDDIVSFQLDDAAPSVKFVDADGNELEDSKQTEGAVWLVAQFDEDEHADDKSRGVTITALTLTDEDTEAVITDDSNAIFGSEENCVDHEVEGDVTLDGAGDSTKATSAQTDKCANRTLAVNLEPGAYNIEMTGVDASGNETTDDVDFTVVEAAPFKLALRPGINFISIPGMPIGDGGDINVMLGSHAVTTVSTYDRSLELQGQNPWLRSTKDAETGMFSGDITMIEPGKAYFITATASSEVKVRLQRGVTELPPTITVRQGYNAIGFWSVSGDATAEIDDYLNSIGWTVAYSYDPTPGRGWTVIRRGEVDDAGDGLLIEEGKGYLVYATYDAVLTP